MNSTLVLSKESPFITDNGNTLVIELTPRIVAEATPPDFLIDVLSTRLNSYSTSTEMFGNQLGEAILEYHRTLQSLMIATLLRTLYYIGTKARGQEALFVDARNEDAIRQCIELAESVDAGKVSVTFPFI